MKIEVYIFGQFLYFIEIDPITGERTPLAKLKNHYGFTWVLDYIKQLQTKIDDLKNDLGEV